MAKDKPKPQEGAGGKLSLLPLCTDLEDPCSMAWSQGLSRMEQRNLALKALSPKDQFELLVALGAGLTHWRCAQLVKCSPRTVTMFVEYCNETIAGGLLAQGVSLQESAAVARACDFFELLIPHIFELGPRSSATGVSYILAQELHSMAKTTPPAAALAANGALTANGALGANGTLTSRVAPDGALNPNIVAPRSNGLKATRLGDQMSEVHSDHVPIMPQVESDGAKYDTIMRVSSQDRPSFATNRIQLSCERLEGTRIRWNTTPEPADNGACSDSLGFSATPKPASVGVTCIQELAARPHGDAISDQNGMVAALEYGDFDHKLISAPIGFEGVVHWAVQATGTADLSGVSCTENTAPKPDPCTCSPALEPDPCTGNQAAGRDPCTPNRALEPDLCTGNQASGRDPCTPNQALEPDPCTGNQPAGRDPCTPNRALEPDPCTGNQASGRDPCTGNQASGRDPCTPNRALEPDPCTGNQASGRDPCTPNRASEPDPCTGNQPPRPDPCTYFQGAWSDPCTDFQGQEPNLCTDNLGLELGTCTSVSACELDFTLVGTPMAETALAAKLDLDHAMTKICIQDAANGHIDYVHDLENPLDPALAVSERLVKTLLNDQMPDAKGAYISASCSAEGQLRDLQRLIWDYWLRHHSHIQRNLQQLQEEGVQGLLMVPSNFKRQASLAAYYEHAQRCQAPDDFSVALGSTAQAFAHLSPALQQGVVWELLLSQWYEGVARYLGPGLITRISQVRSLRRLSGDHMAKLTQVLTEHAPARRSDAAAGCTDATVRCTDTAARRTDAAACRTDAAAGCTDAAARSSLDVLEAQAPLNELGRKSYRGFMARYEPRPLLYDLRWDQPSHKLDSALKQFMRDPSCRRYREGLTAS